MSIADYLSNQPPARQGLLNKIHEIITREDKTVKPEVAPMMGKEMIIYKAHGTFKYGLAGVKNYMSLHVLPIYGSAALHTKYKGLLNKAAFQKGCINFNNEEEMPLDIVKLLMADCSKIDLRAIRETYLKSKSK